MTIRQVVGIHGVPRSGTSWLSQLINSEPKVLMKFQPLFSYSLKDYLDENSDLNTIEKFYQLMIQNMTDKFLNMKDSEIHKNYPYFEKSNPELLVFKQVHHHYLLKHLLSTDLRLKLILIVRSPFAVLSSWKNAPKEFRLDWDFYKEWRFGELKNKDKRENYFGYAKWKEATNLFLELAEIYPERVKLVNYSDLLDDTYEHLLTIFNFIGIPEVGQQSLNFIKSSGGRNDTDPNSVYKSKKIDDEWKYMLPLEVIEKINSDSEFIKLNNIFKWV